MSPYFGSPPIFVGHSERGLYWTVATSNPASDIGNFFRDDVPAVAWVPWVVGGAVVLGLACMGSAVAFDCSCKAGGSWEDKSVDVGLDCKD